MKTREVPWIEIEVPAGLAIIYSNGFPALMRVKRLSFSHQERRPLEVDISGLEAGSGYVAMTGFSVNSGNVVCPILEPFRGNTTETLTLANIPKQVTPFSFCATCDGRNIPAECAFSQKVRDMKRRIATPPAATKRGTAPLVRIHATSRH